MKKSCFILHFFFCLAAMSAVAQAPYLSSLHADKNFPIYTTYAAAQERSQFLLDEGYEMRWYKEDEPFHFHTDTGGDWWLSFNVDGKSIQNLGDYFRQPVIKKSYPDFVELEMMPSENTKLTMRFLVYSSRLAIWETTMENTGSGALSLDVHFQLQKPAETLKHISRQQNGFGFYHREPPDNWMINHDMPHVADVVNYFGMDMEGKLRTSPANHFNSIGLPFGKHTDSAVNLIWSGSLKLNPGSGQTLRAVRAVAPASSPLDSLVRGAQAGFAIDLHAHLKANEKWASRVADPAVGSNQLPLYWSNVNMMRQVFYPPEGKSSYNYYVFSREPTWGWGHGGQVFHESISMLAYAEVDAQSALNSQRVYRERQYENGYINYRTGAYLDEVIEHNGELTSSAPWYNWLNAELHRMTGDRSFLEEMYPSGKKYYEFVVNNRDKDGDGLCEWGGHAILESVRDGLVAVWDEVGDPSHFESLDLNCMLVMEAKSLEYMARQLGKNAEAEMWKQDHQQRAALINKYFWDEENGFYYNVNKADNGFTFKQENDLKRDEIIGFIPLWAGIANEDQARRLVQKLTNEKYFWRPYGIPTLAANDRYYNPKGYWNGPVWVQWNYLVMRGLLDYGYKAEARELTRRVTAGMNKVLTNTHNLWELYSPEEAWGGHHKTYIWAGIANRMMQDAAK